MSRVENTAPVRHFTRAQVIAKYFEIHEPFADGVLEITDVLLFSSETRVFWAVKVEAIYHKDTQHERRYASTSLMTEYGSGATLRLGYVMETQLPQGASSVEEEDAMIAKAEAEAKRLRKAKAVNE